MTAISKDKLFRESNFIQDVLNITNNLLRSHWGIGGQLQHVTPSDKKDPIDATRIHWNLMSIQGKLCRSQSHGGLFGLDSVQTLGQVIKTNYLAPEDAQLKMCSPHKQSTVLDMVAFIIK